MESSSVILLKKYPRVIPEHLQFPCHYLILTWTSLSSFTEAPLSAWILWCSSSSRNISKFLSCPYDVTFCISYLSDCLLRIIQILSIKTKPKTTTTCHNNFFFFENKIEVYMERMLLKCKELRSSGAPINIHVFTFGKKAGSSIFTVRCRKQHQTEHIPWPLSFRSLHGAKVCRKQQYELSSLKTVWKCISWRDVKLGLHRRLWVCASLEF